jgi:hypothetical protein
MHQPERIGLLRLVEHVRRKQRIAGRLMPKVDHKMQIAGAGDLAPV